MSQVLLSEQRQPKEQTKVVRMQCDMFVSPLQEVGITAISWVICSSSSAWSAGWCTAAFPVSRKPLIQFVPVVSLFTRSTPSLLSLPPQTGRSTVPPVMPRMVSGSIWPRSPLALPGCSGCSSTASSTSCGWRCSSCVSSIRSGFTFDTPLLNKA